MATNMNGKKHEAINARTFGSEGEKFATRVEERSQDVRGGRKYIRI